MPKICRFLTISTLNVATQPRAVGVCAPSLSPRPAAWSNGGCTWLMLSNFVYVRPKPVRRTDVVPSYHSLC